MMKIILLTISLFSLNCFALEWNQKSFKDSLNGYKNNLEEWSKNPSKIIKDLKNKYEPTVKLLQDEVNTFDYKKSLDPVKGYYNLFENKYKSYASLNEKDLFNTFSRDVSTTFQWAYQNFDSVPVIGPYKQELQMKANLMKVQMVPYRYMVEGALQRSF